MDTRWSADAADASPNSSPVPPPVMPPVREGADFAPRPRHRDMAAAQELSRLEGKVGSGARNMGMVLALGLVFLGVASLIKPDPRSATANPGGGTGAMPVAGADGLEHIRTVKPERAAEVAAELARTPHPKGWKLLGLLQDQRYHVLVYTSPDGPRYSVFALTGALLEADLPADQIYRVFPDLDVTKLRADPPNGVTPTGPLMLADPKGIGD